MELLTQFSATKPTSTLSTSGVACGTSSPIESFFANGSLELLVYKLVHAGYQQPKSIFSMARTLQFSFNDMLLASLATIS